jgi:hypothetical protein
MSRKVELSRQAARLTHFALEHLAANADEVQEQLAERLGYTDPNAENWAQLAYGVANDVAEAFKPTNICRSPIQHSKLTVGTKVLIDEKKLGTICGALVNLTTKEGDTRACYPVQLDEGYYNEDKTVYTTIILINESNLTIPEGDKPLLEQDFNLKPA